MTREYAGLDIGGSSDIVVDEDRELFARVEALRAGIAGESSEERHGGEKRHGGEEKSLVHGSVQTMKCAVG
jgi:hypothetical protein